MQRPGIDIDDQRRHDSIVHRGGPAAQPNKSRPGLSLCRKRPLDFRWLAYKLGKILPVKIE
jgi:hypothetical protein